MLIFESFNHLVNAFGKIIKLIKRDYRLLWVSKIKPSHRQVKFTNAIYQYFNSNFLSLFSFVCS